MLKHLFIYLILSILVVIFAPYVYSLMQCIDSMLQYTHSLLAPYFSPSEGGLIFRNVLLVILIPVLIAAVPALFYKLIRKKDMPHFMALVWILWAMLILSDLLVR